MTTERFTLQGQHIRLEPLEHRHLDGLVAAAGDDAALYQWSPVPRGKAEAASYIDTALAWRDAGSAVPFAIVRTNDDVVPRFYPFLEHRAMVLAARPSHRTGAVFPTPARSATPG